MTRFTDMCLGATVGAGLMFLLDPRMGPTRRSFLRDKAVGMSHDIQNAAGKLQRDAGNRMQGLAHGDLTAITGRGIPNPLSGNLSPTARALMGITGAGLFLFGLTRSAPLACVLGTVGVALAAEGATNASWEDIKQVPRAASEKFQEVRENVASCAGM